MKLCYHLSSVNYVVLDQNYIFDLPSTDYPLYNVILLSNYDISKLRKLEFFIMSFGCSLIEDFRFIFCRSFSNQNLTWSLIKWLQSRCHICVRVPKFETFGFQLHDVTFPGEIKIKNMELLLFFYVNVQI